MAIDVTDLSTLNPTVVSERQQLLIQMLNEAYPELDFSHGGILQQLVAQPNAVLDVMNRQEILNMQNSMSVLTVTENPELADTALVDALLSNYLLTRQTATACTGVVAIVLSQNISVSIDATVAITLNGRTFNADKTYIAVTNPALVLNDSTRLLQVRSDGNYWFMINVMEDTASGTSIPQGTAFAMNPQPLNFVEAYAAVDFTSGTTQETNAAFIARLLNGISAKAMSDRVSITALLRAEFPSITDVSIIGYGDSEMSRDRANILGVGHGGKADVVVRTSGIPPMVKITVAASPIAARFGQVNVIMGPPYNPPIMPVTLGDSAYDGVYEFGIPPTAIPGFYRVEKITPVDPTSSTTSEFSGYYEPTDRGIYVPADQEFVPTINTAIEARYTPYQGNAYVRFTDPNDVQTHLAAVQAALAGVTSIAVYVNNTLTTLATFPTTSTPNSVDYMIRYQGYRFYDVYVSAASLLSDIQSFLNAREQRCPAADYLVKGAIPCFVSVSLTVGYQAGTTPPTVATIQSAVADAINGLQFTETTLQTSLLVTAVSVALAGYGYVILPLSMTGQLELPDGTQQVLSGQNSLDIPSLPALDCSRRTTAYYAYPEDVSVTLQPVSSWSV